MGVTPNGTPTPIMIADFLKKAISDEIKRATEEEIDQAMKRLEKRKAQIITGVTLYVEKAIKYETLGNMLSITVRLEDNSK